MRNPRFLFWFIIALTILAILIDLPKTIDLPFKKKIYGFNPNFFIGPLHIQKNFSFRKGLDIEGGVSITYKADMQNIKESQQKDALDSAKAVIERRINFFGVSEPVVQTSKIDKESRIIVEIPGVSDVDSAVKLIGTTAQLSFWEDASSSSSASAQMFASPSAMPLGIIESLGPKAQMTDLTGSDLQQTSVTFDKNTGNPQVELIFTTDGAKKFADITKRNVNKRVAIVIDNQVIEAPRVNQEITGGNAVITGGFTTDIAKALSIQLNSGALPVPLTILQQRTIGPTLGMESLQKSLFAGVLGFIVIAIFMAVLYGGLGILADVALLLYTLFVLALFKLIPVTLTLAGLAGFILSIGMAVDANILIFERMREELRRGKRKDVAMELGFSRAWNSIRDSNVSSLITSFILFQFGTGGVRGFALTLAIGVLISMFSAIIVTRTFLRLIYGYNR